MCAKNAENCGIQCGKFLEKWDKRTIRNGSENALYKTRLLKCNDDIAVREEYVKCNISAYFPAANNPACWPQTAHSAFGRTVYFRRVDLELTTRIYCTQCTCVMSSPKAQWKCHNVPRYLEIEKKTTACKRNQVHIFRTWYVKCSTIA